MTYQEFIEKLQTELNKHGSHLTVDGDPGDYTKGQLANYDVDFVLHPKVVVVPSGDHFNAPWVFSNIDLLGRTETDPVLNARYVPEWALEGLSEYKTLAGNAHAWCSVRENADKRKVGVKGTGDAGAAGWSHWGVDCPYWFGASLPIQHATGGRHIADFLYWIDKANKIAAVLGGNQGDKFSIVSNNLSGNAHGHDQVIPGPRGPVGWVGQEVSMADVLAKYPFLKVGGVGGSTT